MSRRAVAALVVGAITATAGVAADPVPVKGTSVAYAPTIDVAVKDKAVRLDLTGVGVRTRVGFDVYAVARYVQEGTAVRTAEDVVGADAVRMLHLVMLRTVEPAEFVGALRAAVARTYPADEFAAEFARVVGAVGDNAAEKGDHVTLLSVPGEGVRIRLARKADVTVKSPAFARALWEVYLGPNPLNEGLKAGLVGRLKP